MTDCLTETLLNVLQIGHARQNIMAHFGQSAFTVRLQKLIFPQTTIDCLTTDKTNNNLYDETVFLSYIDDDTVSHILNA